MKQQYFAQFYNMSVNYDGNHPSQPIEACGSDGVCPLDGRLSLFNMGIAAQNHLERLKGVGRNFAGYSLHVGTYSKNRTIKGFTKFV